jgi:hypothetical protein
MSDNETMNEHSAATHHQDVLEVAPPTRAEDIPFWKPTPVAEFLRESLAALIRAFEGIDGAAHIMGVTLCRDGDGSLESIQLLIATPEEKRISAS